MRKQLEQYYTNQWGIFIQKMQSASQAYDEDVIHDMRVSVKRLRALFGFVEFVRGGKFDAKRELATLISFYKKSGAVRDVQVQEGMLKKLEKYMTNQYPLYRKYLKKLRKKKISQFLDSAATFKPKQLDTQNKHALKAIQKLQEDELARKSNDLVYQKIQSIRELFLDPYTDRNLHDIRKQLKAIQYLREFFYKDLSAFDKLQVSYERQKEIGSLLGEWHDLQNSILFLRKFLKDEKLPAGSKYHHLYKNVLKLHNRFRNMIVSTIHEEMMLSWQLRLFA